MKVELRIERLVLDGIPMSPADAVLLRRAVEAELGRLVAVDGVPARLVRTAPVESLHVGMSGSPQSETRPSSFGVAIAAAVYDGISR